MEEIITLKNINFEYLSTKHDKYENEICYLKTKDKHIDQK